MSIIIGNQSIGGSACSTGSSTATTWLPVAECDICLDIATLPTCGANCDFTVSAVGNTIPIGLDTTTVFSATATGDAGTGVATDMIETEYTDQQGNVVTGVGSINTMWGDLAAVSSTINTGLISMLKVDAINGNIATVRIFGDAAGCNLVELDLNNPPQPSFYSFIETTLNYFYPFWTGAVSNVKNLGKELTFEYDLSFTSVVVEEQWWLNQCSFLLQEPTLQTAQLLSSLTFRYPLRDVGFTRTITYNNGCPSVIIRKKIIVDSAIQPYINYHVKTI
jgi:hypothetical protein